MKVVSIHSSLAVLIVRGMGGSWGGGGGGGERDEVRFV